MSGSEEVDYDVVIMGGGPAGSTLGALLVRGSNLRVVLYEKEKFPREHIGESFAHPLIPVLEESGALPRVLSSSCWVKKYGGIFNWDEGNPSIAFFDHANWLADGVHRWAMHVNRSEFDKILLEHARDSGVEVHEATALSALEKLPNHSVVTLKDGRKVSCRFFVDASGRRNSMATGKKREWLSNYRNIAIWQHYLGCRPAQSLSGEWNIFRGKNVSPIGCFAFRDGWCWFIPIPKIVDGGRRLTHSIGIVTSPLMLKEPGRDLTEPKIFLRTIKEVPLLADLVQDAVPVGDRMNTATNYSMINDRFADYGERWILVGDSSYFVDPLFSSGVAFAAAQASAAALVLRTSCDPDVPEQHKMDLWHDYDEGWHGMAETYGLSIDQWYHAIAKNHPDSVYWRTRGTSIDLNIRERTFQALLSTAFTPDLLQVMTHGTRRYEDLHEEGPFRRARVLAEPINLQLSDILELAPSATWRESVALDVPGFKAFVPPPAFELPAKVKAGIAEYWQDPVANSASAPAPHASPLPCRRLFVEGAERRQEVRSINERDGGSVLWEALRSGPVTYGDLVARVPAATGLLLKQLVRAGVVIVNADVAALAEAPAGESARRS